MSLRQKDTIPRKQEPFPKIPDTKDVPHIRQLRKMLGFGKRARMKPPSSEMPSRITWTLSFSGMVHLVPYEVDDKRSETFLTSYCWLLHSITWADFLAGSPNWKQHADVQSLQTLLQVSRPLGGKLLSESVGHVMTRLEILSLNCSSERTT
jgi:hypothetical protein